MSLTDRAVFVKNDDASITYVGEWTTVQASVVSGFGNFGQALSSTLHSTTATGSLSFPFRGSSINAVGSVNIANASTSPNPTWKCVLDGVAFSPNIFQFPENNWSLCSQGNIPDGEHELIINVTSQGMPFYIDYIEYQPSASVSLENKFITIDNLDPAIDYISGWGALGGTANQTTDPKSLVNVTFVGIQLSWYGFVPTEEPHNASSGEYSVDGQPFVSFQLTGLPPGTSSSVATEYNQLFFMTPMLDMGTHVLSAKYTGSPGQTPLTLDYLIVANGSFSSTSAASSSRPDQTGKAGASPATGAHKAKKSSDVGAIVGGVVGGIVGLVVCLAALFFWLRYRRRRAHDIDYHDVISRHGAIEPFSIQPEIADVSQSTPLIANQSSQDRPAEPLFTLPQVNVSQANATIGSQTSRDRGTAGTGSYQHHPSQPSVGQASSAWTVSSHPASSSNNPASPSATDDTESSGAFPPNSNSGNRRPLPSTPPVLPLSSASTKEPAPALRVANHVQHEDSGIRLPQPVIDAIVEIPPTYSEQ